MANHLNPSQTAELHDLRRERRSQHEREYQRLLAELLADDSPISDEQREEAERLCQVTGRSQADFANDLRGMLYGNAELHLVREAGDATLKYFDQAMRLHRQPR